MIDRLIFKIKGVPRALMRCSVFSLILSALIVGQAFCLTTALVNLWYAHPLEEQIGYLIGFCLCLLARQLVDNLQSTWLESFAQNRADEFRTQLFGTLFAQGQTLVQTRGTGGISTLLIEGVDQVESYLRMMIPRMTRLLIVPIVLLILLFALDWVSAIIGLLVFPAIILQMVLIGHTASIEAGKQHKEYRRLANHFLDSIRGIDTLKLFGRSENQSKRIFISSERFRNATMRTLRIATLSGAVLDAFSTISIAAIAVMLGFRLVDGSLALFPALFVLVIMPDYFRPIREFASDYHASLEGKNSLKTILTTLDECIDEKNREAQNTQTTDPDTSNACKKDIRFKTSSKMQPAGDSPLSPIGRYERHDLSWNRTSTLELKGVSFAYDADASFALKDIDATFNGYQNIAIVGMSGSGKSTLAHILAGLNDPASGTVSINGIDLRTLKNPQWQHQIAYIPQDPHIFNMTLKENLAFYAPTASNEEILKVCSLVGLDELLQELPQGIDTIIGEGGHSLSGGQAQRIAFARAFLNSDCKILIFDEPTAHLDIETELELKERMLSLMRDKLVFFATHRLHWLSDMDSVLYLQNGHLIAQGTPSELQSIWNPAPASLGGEPRA